MKVLSLALPILLSLSPLAARQVDQASRALGLTGHWQGAIVIASAEQEVEVAIDLATTQEGRLAGQLWFPLAGPSRYDMDSLALQDTSVSFSVRDETGTVTSFKGEIVADAPRIRGNMTEAGKTLPFTLDRRSGPAEKSDPVPLRDGLELPALFNRDHGLRRVVMILSPASFSSRMTLSLFRRYVLEQNADPDIRIYVLWEVPKSIPAAEAERVIRQNAALAADARVTHLWSTANVISAAFKPFFDAYRYQEVANPCLLFSGNKKWSETAPVADRFFLSPKMGSKVPVPAAARFNGIQLGLEIALLPLGKKPG